MRRRPVSWLIVTAVVSLAFPSFGSDASLSEGLEPLRYRLGSWTAAVEWLSPAGEVSRVVPSLLFVESALDGHAIQSEGRLIGTRVSVISFIYVDDETGKVTEVGLSGPGRLDTLHATIEQDRVIFTAEPRSRGEQSVIFRAIDSNIQADSYDTTGWISTDGGKTWRQTFRQTNHRIDS